MSNHLPGHSFQSKDVLAQTCLFVRLVFAITLADPAWGEPNTNLVTFAFKDPLPVTYQVPLSRVGLASARPVRWISVEPKSPAGEMVRLGDRVVLQTAPGVSLASLLDGNKLLPDRELAPGFHILQATDAWEAANEAQRLAQLPGVQVSHPVRARGAKLHRSISAHPNDPLYGQQWHLENRNPVTGLSQGISWNLRSAWGVTRGQGVTVAQGDNGIELDHPDLVGNLDAGGHRNFVSGTSSGWPMSSAQSHGTSVAGLIAGVQNNKKGVSGVAPEVRLASLVLFDTSDNLGSEEAVMDAFQYRSNVVAVQNHSWGNASAEQMAMGSLESLGLKNAIEYGRSGRGVVFVRAAGNERSLGNNVNDDGYAKDTRVITVGALRINGQIASYSTPGTAVLVSAWSGDSNVDLPNDQVTNYPGLVSTDRQGALGYNTDSLHGDAGDYVTGGTAFSGTSGSAPLISGLCALILSANPGLTYRDVQQILILAAQQTDPKDPEIQTNGAGLRVSFNSGFGLPDAGQAVWLAQHWTNQPAATTVSVNNSTGAPIPDDGLRVALEDPNAPVDIQSIPAYPSDGQHPSEAKDFVPLVDEGAALEPITDDLTNQAALIRRGTNYFVEKITHAANAGARFAIIYNNRDGDVREYMSGADVHLAPIPAVFISQNSGEALAGYLQRTPRAKVQLKLDAVTFDFAVTKPLSCEHVWLDVDMQHPRRADVRITLISPSGTRSVLQRFNQDLTSPLGTWTYTTAHHFYESSVGTWRVEIADERPGKTGSVNSLTLHVSGLPMTDSDHDGLDDEWERKWFSGLDAAPGEDPDADGYSNAAEQVLASNPKEPNEGFQLTANLWDSQKLRVSWPGVPGSTYQVEAAEEAGRPFSVLTNLPGVFPEMEWLMDNRKAGSSLIRVQRQ